MSSTGGVSQPPAEFLDALTGLRKAARRSEIRLEEIQAPSRLAPFAAAFGAEVFDSVSPPPLHGPARNLVLQPEPEERATGRFILLHDPAGSDVWNGRFRIVTYLRARLEGEAGGVPRLGSVAWSWLMEGLATHGARHHSAGGTVTRILSESHGMLEDRADTVDLELRASWSPETADVRRHLEAWSELVATSAGLPPLPEGVLHLHQRRP